MILQYGHYQLWHKRRIQRIVCWTVHESSRGTRGPPTPFGTRRARLHAPDVDGIGDQVGEVRRLRKTRHVSRLDCTEIGEPFRMLTYCMHTIKGVCNANVSRNPDYESLVSLRTFCVGLTVLYNNGILIVSTKVKKTDSDFWSFKILQVSILRYLSRNFVLH